MNLRYSTEILWDGSEEAVLEGLARSSAIATACDIGMGRGSTKRYNAGLF